MKLFIFIIASDVGFHYAGCVYVFLYGIVQNIVLIKYLDKMGMRFFGNEDQQTSQERYGYQKNESDLRADCQSHDKRQDNHNRSADQQTDGHHISHLNVGQVCCQPGHQTGCGKPVDILK